MGRSYGDSALNDQVLLTTGLNKMIAFNEHEGILTCEAGVSLADIVTTFLPRGWFLSVTPGTKNITVGGAIASDVHGKNHHCAGCFSAYVLSFDLMTADGKVYTCSRTTHSELFQATCGGMGLTGIIMSAILQLQRVGSAFMRQKTIKAHNLEEVLGLFEQYSSWPYSVAWIDCFAPSRQLGRSLFMIGEHFEDRQFRSKETMHVSLPFGFPGILLNKYSVSCFNSLYYGKSRKRVSDRLTTIDRFFYPLDAMSNWNIMYGKNGFVQYQFVIPQESGFQGLQTILTRIARAGLGSFLTVLKLFGPENDNYLSFPMTGYTLALDFKREPQLFPFLKTLDTIVLDFGGRLYLTKDSRMSPEMLKKGYPKLNQFKEIRSQYHLDEKFNSHQSKRLGI
jgi:FAD/FMN-containing dehydrogenase